MFRDLPILKNFTIGNTQILCPVSRAKYKGELKETTANRRKHSPTAATVANAAGSLFHHHQVGFRHRERAGGAIKLRPDDDVIGAGNIVDTKISPAILDTDQVRK
jgi:hypothetical protein